MVSSFALFSAFFASALSLEVTSPSKDTVWTTGKSQTIKWQSVDSDESSFNVYLSNFASYPTQTILLASGVDSSKDSLTVDADKLVAGNSFTINFTNGTKTEQIYAQSSQFNITASSDAATTTSTGIITSTTIITGAHTPTGNARSDTSAIATGSSTASGSSASSTSSSHKTSGAGKIVTSWTLALSAAVAAFVL